RSPSSAIHSHFFSSDAATTEIHPLSLHDALPISLTALEAHVSIGLCPSDGNGFRNNFRDKFASQNGAERIAPPPWRENGYFRRLGHACGIPVKRRLDRRTQSGAGKCRRF